MVKKLTPKDKGDAVRRMVRHALEFLVDSEVIEAAESVSGSQARGAYVLQLLGLEILLKANALRESGDVLHKHEVDKLFSKQPKAFQARIRDWYDDVLWIQEHETQEVPLKGQLKRLGRNFETYRYDYEKTFFYSAEEMAERERAFIAGDLPGDTTYHQGLLDRLIRELLQDLQAYRSARLPEVRWEPDED